MSRPAALATIAVLAEDPEAAELLRDLVEIATATRRDLLTARSRDDVQRVRQLRRLLQALYTDGPVSQDASHVRNNETVPAAVLTPSASEVGISVQEAAEVLAISTRRVQQLVDSGQLTGERDGPRRPWRLDPTSVHAYRQRHRSRTA
jgi:excisionase family DNA binding protein